MVGRRKELAWLTARPIAHRGFHDLTRGRPENSLAAFEAAVEHRYAIECDLHLSSDSVPIVFHDDDLGRLTGTSGCVRDRSAAELRGLRLHGTTEGVPSLDALLELTDGRVPLVLELKRMPGRDSGFARAVAERLRRYDGPVALMSFDPALIADVKAAAPHLARGLTAEGDWRSGADHIRAMTQLRVDFISYAIRDLPTPVPVLANKVFGVPLICWTVRSPEQLRKAKAWTDQITFEGFEA